MRRPSAHRIARSSVMAALLLLAGGALFNVAALSRPTHQARNGPVQKSAQRLLNEGRRIFRFDTFGDEKFWSGTLQLDKAIAGAKNGGVGPGLTPAQALGVGLKVDSTALPAALVKAIKAGKVNLKDPATTLALLKLNAVVGVRAHFARGRMTSVGLTCAVCHSTVDNSFAKGIGKRLDGWPNRDLNVGAIISIAPNLQPVADVLGTDVATVKKVVGAWGPGKFDAELFLDGKGFRPDGKTAATLIPPAYGLGGVNLHTYEGWGSIPYWNAFVAILEMHGQGNFTDERLNDPAKFPVAAKNGFGHVRVPRDMVSKKLPALQFYQLALRAPRPRSNAYNHAAAKRGRAIFMGKGRCASCHVPPTYTEPGWDMHRPAEICTDSFQADRAPDGMYRTTPLHGLLAHRKHGYYHDGRYATLSAVVDHYDSCMNLGLTPSQKTDLVQFLRSR
jgi:hypothetical protein